MTCVFYDLETTDLSTVGQIINFAFVLTDNNYNVTDEFCGKIKLGKTQLPNPYAILANRVDVLELQAAKDTYTEKEAMDEIYSFLTEAYETSRQGFSMIGYNNVRFDLLYLRTCLTRNGLNPYIGGKYTNHRDVLHACQKVACIDPVFKQKFLTADSKVSLKLERVAQKTGLLVGKQSHESRDDVYLTIELAKWIRNTYALDVHSYDSYEVKNYENNGTVIQKIHPSDQKYHDNEDENPANSGRMTLLEKNERYSLWIDLDKWKAGEGKKSISWYNKKTSPFFVPEASAARLISDISPEEVEQAKKDLSQYNLANFFDDKNCDVEAHIYRLDLYKSDGTRPFDNFCYAIKTNSPKELLDKHSANLYIRYVINNSKDWEKFIKPYALYRYGGRMKTNRFDCVSKYQEGVYNEDFHPTWNEMVEQLNNMISESKSDDDTKLLTSLKTYYFQSEIYRSAGNELDQINRQKA